jgi:hypothetical protein
MNYTNSEEAYKIYYKYMILTLIHPIDEQQNYLNILQALTIVNSYS